MSYHLLGPVGKKMFGVGDHVRIPDDGDTVFDAACTALASSGFYSVIEERDAETQAFLDGLVWTIRWLAEHDQLGSSI